MAFFQTLILTQNVLYITRAKNVSSGAVTAVVTATIFKTFSKPDDSAECREVRVSPITFTPNGFGLHNFVA